MTDVTKIDEMLNKATARKAVREKAEGKAQLTPEQKQQAQEQKAQERAEAKAKRDEERASKKAAKEANARVPHTLKVERARAKLPQLTDRLEAVYNDVTVNYSAQEIAALSAHLTFFNREKSTELAAKSSYTPKAGDSVQITGGDPRYVGQIGTVAKAQRIRLYVQLDNGKKPVYLFVSDVAPVEGTQKVAANG